MKTVAWKPSLHIGNSVDVILEAHSFSKKIKSVLRRTFYQNEQISRNYIYPEIDPEMYTRFPKPGFHCLKIPLHDSF